MSLARSSSTHKHGQRRTSIVQALLTLVFQGKLRAGERLVAQELADRLGVSQTPIREALIQLAGIGIVDLSPNRGAVVRRFTARDVRNILQVRKALECEAVRRATGRIPLGDLQDLSTELQGLMGVTAETLADLLPRARAIDSRLHDLIAQESGNPFLAAELNRLKILYRAFRDVTYSRREAQVDFVRLREEAREHLAIVEGLLAGDARAAALAMVRHLRSGVTYWTRAMPETAAAPIHGAPRKPKTRRLSE